MSVTWKIETIQHTDGSDYSTVAWRANGEHGATIYGTVSILHLSVDHSTTEQEIVEKVKHVLNSSIERRDEHGNLIPPNPGENTKTSEIELALAEQATEIAAPKTKTVKLPWVD